MSLPLPATAVLAERLGALMVEDAVKHPSGDDLGAISRRIDAALARGEQVSRKDLRHAPWCIFATRTPLAADSRRLDELLCQIAALGRPRPFRALAAAYLHYFDPVSNPIRIVAAFLVMHIEHLGEPWASAHRAAALFIPAKGAEELAKMALAWRCTPDAVFRKLGFLDPTKLEGLRKHAFFRGLEEIAKGDNADPLKRLGLVLDWASDDGRPRYEEARARVANALLLPFGETTPAQHMRDRYLAVVLPILGDPRTSPGKWVGCEKAEKIVRRWLTEASLRQFFEVVDKVAAPEHWIYRRAFWNALHERGYVSEAWVVFDGHGAGEAKRIFGKDISFGVFEGGGVQPGHSTLLLRIGSLVVAEWSHNGKCRIWDEDSGIPAPRLFQKNYDASDLRREYAQSGSSGQGIFSHHGSLSYSWQRNIAAFLKQRRNITLRPSDYEVRQ
jgi:hypothetical protein